MNNFNDFREFFELVKKDKTHFYKLLNCKPWQKQIEITQSIFENKRVTVRSCHGIGKSYISARIALLFLFYNYYFNKKAVVLTTAPTYRQVEQVLWKELHSAYGSARIPLGGKLTRTQYEINSENYIFGFASDKPDYSQGIHCENMLIISDEAGACEDRTLQGLEAHVTAENNRILYIGNPTNPLGGFYNSFSSNFWHKIKISAFDTPNFIDNNIKNLDDLKNLKQDDIEAIVNPYPYLVTPLWAWERLHEWGEDNPLFIARVLADFPTSSEDMLFDLTKIEECYYSEVDETINKLSIGGDIARGGKDFTIITVLKNNEVVEINKSNSKDLMTTTGTIVNIAQKYNFTNLRDVIVIDDVGLGGGVTNRLRELNYNVVAEGFGSSPINKQLYFNRKAELYGILKNVINDKRIKLLKNDKLLGELLTIKAVPDSEGRLKIISKADMTKSPDYVDSLVYAYSGLTNSKKITYTKIESSIVGDIRYYNF